MTHTGVHRWRLPAILGAVLVIAAGCTGPGATHRTATAANTPPAMPATARASTAPTAPSATPRGAVDAPCTYKLIATDLPVWARQGFHGPLYNAFPFVTTNRRDVVGVLFGYPLQAPPLNTANKILWVPNDLSAGKLTVDAIHAALEGSGGNGRHRVPRAMTALLRTYGPATAIRCLAISFGRVEDVS